MNNSMETLKKARQELAFAEDFLKASQDAVKEAQKAYTEAYKAFKEEADGLLREDDKTSDMSSEEGCDEDSPESFVAMYKPIDDCFDDLSTMVLYNAYTVKKYRRACGGTYYIVYCQGRGLFFSSDSFCKRFERVVE